MPRMVVSKKAASKDISALVKNAVLGPIAVHKNPNKTETGKTTIENARL